jgi:hypothetical protein
MCRPRNLKVTTVIRSPTLFFHPPYCCGTELYLSMVPIEIVKVHEILLKV